MNLTDLEKKVKSLIEYTEMKKDIEKTIDDLKAEVIPQVKAFPVEEDNIKQWRVVFKDFEAIVSQCEGRTALDEAKAKAAFPILNSEEFKKKGKPYDMFKYTVHIH